MATLTAATSASVGCYNTTLPIRNSKSILKKRTQVKAMAMGSKGSSRVRRALQLGLGLAASAVMATGSAGAAEVLMGGNGGELVFLPSDFTVAAGETITFKNNAGFPHNVIFDEDEVPAGVDPASISMSEEDLLNGPGDTYTVKLDKKGTYRFYCAPHQGVGMSGTVTVN